MLKIMADVNLYYYFLRQETWFNSLYNNILYLDFLERVFIAAERTKLVVKSFIPSLRAD